MSDELTRTFDLSRVGAGGISAICDALHVDSTNVRHHQYDAASGILSVELTHAEAAGHIEEFIAGMRQTQKLMRRKVVRESAVTAQVRDIDATLAASPDVQILGDGLIGLRGELLALFRFLERRFREIAAEFGAEEQHYPVMVPREVLAEVGYLSHFPQHVTFCSHLPGDLPVLQAVAADASPQVASRLGEPQHVLTPAVCLPCYRQHRGAVIDGVRTLTMQNHVFRYEGTNFRPLQRGWDFTVRDVVFFGAGDDLERLREAVMDRAMALCAELGLRVSIELANDPFFLDTSRDKAVYQRMGEVKYELLFPLHDGGALAASSFNLHRDFYTSVYDTRLANGERAESACMGFGIERWLYGYLTQKWTG
jgi:seryl-tRNA synthetase